VELTEFHIKKKKHKTALPTMCEHIHMPAHEALQMAFTALSEEYPAIREQVGLFSFVHCYTDCRTSWLEHIFA
jgi:hypothetical protein